MLITISLKI